MPILLLFLLSFAVSLFAATPPTDTVFVQLQANVMGPSPKVPVGIWKAKAPKKGAPVILWFHGGMTSGNCEKGLVAGSDMAQLLPRYTVVSPSACRQNHWVEPSTIQAVDAALDSLGVRQGMPIVNLSLVGISDGSLGAIAYSLWGKRKIERRLLISSFGANLGPATEVAREIRQKEGSWRFIQGGKDRLYPADQALPWIQEFCQNIGSTCDLKFDPQGEHDWKYWQEHRRDWFLKFFYK